MGNHAFLDFQRCSCHEDILLHPSIGFESILKIIQDSKLTICKSDFFSFGENMGYSGFAILAESHVSVHTWPEKKMINADVYACNVSEDNLSKVEFIVDKLKNLFQPMDFTIKIIKR